MAVSGGSETAAGSGTAGALTTARATRMAGAGVAAGGATLSAGRTRVTTFGSGTGGSAGAPGPGPRGMTSRCPGVSGSVSPGFAARINSSRTLYCQQILATVSPARTRWMVLVPATSSACSRPASEIAAPSHASKARPQENATRYQGGRSSAELLQRRARDAADAPVREHLGAELPVKLDGVLVPIQDCPLEPSASPRHRQVRQARDQRPPQAPAPELRTHEQIFQVNPRPGQEGWKSS